MFYIVQTSELQTSIIFICLFFLFTFTSWLPFTSSLHLFLVITWLCESVFLFKV